MTKRVRLLIAACCLAGLAIGAAWPPPPIPRTPEGTNSWSLPAPDQLERFSGEAFARADKVRWMGDEADPIPGAAAAASWRLAGFVEMPDPRALIIVSTAPRLAKQVAVGSPLPDGSQLRNIERDTITIDRDGCVVVYQLYRDQPVSSSGACAPDDGHGAKEVP